MKTALAIASTSLHLIYLAELVYKHGIENVEIVVLLKRETDRPQIEKVLAEIPHTKVHWAVRTRPIENQLISIFEVLSLKSLDLQFDAYDYGIFADYGRSMLANVECEKYYWLGDGTKLLFEISASGNKSFNRYKRQKLVEPLVKLLLGKRLVLEKLPVIFTPFCLAGVTCEANSFEWLRSRYAFPLKESDLSVVYFFGSYFSERAGKPLLSDASYLAYLRKIAAYFSERGLRVMYIPHRHESAEKLRQVAAIPDCEIQYFNYPAELEFFKRGSFPAHIASFFSTCLFHFSVMGVCKSVTSFRVDFGRSNPAYGAVAESIYTALVRQLGESSVVVLDAVNGQCE